MANPVETWKAEKHGFDVWPDVLRYAEAHAAMKDIETPDLERMKWHGVFYRKRDTADSYMLRIRLPGGELTAKQAKEIAYVAYDCGYGIIDVTTRANVQVQGLPIEQVPKALERLAAVGLSAKQTGHDNVRNVFGHALSGVDPDEILDVRELCRQITDIFMGSRVYSDLPRKMNIAVNGRADHAAHYWSQDISFLVCRTPEGEPMFQVLIGGTQGQNPRLAWHLPVLVTAEQAVDVTRALLDLFRAKGSREKRDRARFRYLIEEIGIGGVLAWLEEQLPYPLRPCPSEPQPAGSYEELVGWFRQRQAGLWSMGLCIPLGRLTWQQLDALGRAAKKWGDGSLRTTIEQGIAILNVPTGFKDAAATDVAACGLSLHADSLVRNTVACTGKQFCNIAVTETKGHMFQLVERLRQRALALHGIRIHMSGCPSSCAQQYTADIGLKGVRVRRLLGTREGFDVFLGGGISGQVHLAMPFKLGVDVDQLPQLIEEVVQEYYLKHRPGQTFSAYWREELRHREAAAVGDRDYVPPVWLCEGCGYRHLGEDPPVFCPKCAGLRRLFARLENDEAGAEDVAPASAASAPVRSDGFVYAAKAAAISPGAGLSVEIGGKELALFRVGDAIHALDALCPHEGAPLAQGEVVDGVVTCPWHGWTFNACTGCSIEPKDRDVARYETLLEGDDVFVRVGESAPATATTAAASTQRKTKKLPTPVRATLRIKEVIEETPDVKTFRLDNSAGQLPAHLPGQFAQVRVELNGREIWRSFTISSSPTKPKTIDLTIKRNPAGEVSNYLHDQLAVGGELTLKGPQGGFYFDVERHVEPLTLISAGSGATPMMSILRYLVDMNSDLPCAFLYGARGGCDILFGEECAALAERAPHLQYMVSLTEPPPGWPGLSGRLNCEAIAALLPDLAARRYFLCGPGGFIDSIRAGLLAAGVEPAKIHSEEFQVANVRGEACQR